ncbi:MULTISPECIES: c-type cytochrome [Psychrobacter]|uniref:Cytochrome c class II n=1 Tax=Psychrobacter alimentarius TaxID=261164 RepID=A0ABN4MZJ7_9GAMM|nr:MULTISPECIES: cytochrome c [Psychrobacter]AMT95912.1 Cytochrome c class II [Psychrobacter alimentarius]QCB31665.1 cytochrome c [Psychrobacter sp. PAMC27889]
MTQVYTNKSLKSVISITLMTAALGLTACSSPTDTDVKTRQDSMKSWGDAMGVMGDMVKAPDTFDAAVFKEQAAFLAEDSSTPWSHFENQDAAGNATEAVWSNADGFSAESDNFQKVTAELSAAAQTATSVDDVAPAFSEVGASCKSCHTEFRAKAN